MNYGKTITILCDIRLCEGLCHELEKIGQTTKGKIEVIKSGKGEIRKLHIYIYIYIYKHSKHIIPIMFSIVSFPETGVL